MTVRWLDNTSTGTDERGMLTRDNEMKDSRYTSLKDIVTAKQLGIIRNIANNYNLDPQLECRHLHGCEVSELSKKGATALIDHLEGMKRKLAA